MIIEDYVSFEVAKLLKLKGFNKDYPKGDCTQYACTLQMAIKWLREEKNIIVNVWYNGVDWDAEYYNNEDENFYPTTDSSFNSYEEAVDAALKYVLENLI
jgi:hypothetical protein